MSNDPVELGIDFTDSAYVETAMAYVQEVPASAFFEFDGSGDANLTSPAPMVIRGPEGPEGPPGIPGQNGVVTLPGGTTPPDGAVLVFDGQSAGVKAATVIDGGNF